MSDYITETIGGATVTRLAMPAPAPVIVPTVSMRQAKLALYAGGHLAAVEAAISALPEPQRTLAQIEWTSAAVVERNSATVALIASAAGLTESQLDALFAQAATL